MARSQSSGFAVWITGLPASGKSTLAKALAAEFVGRGLDPQILESDALRQVFTPDPRFDEQEREIFYRQVAFIGKLLTRHGIPVIIDATANRRAYRDAARQSIPRFIEVYVDTPLAACIARDPKAIYARAQQGNAGSVPGLQAAYEPPLNPDVVMHGDRDQPGDAARRVIAALAHKGYLAP